MKLQAGGIKFIENDTLVLVFFCYYGEIFNNKYFVKYLQTAASKYSNTPPEINFTETDSVLTIYNT